MQIEIFKVPFDKKHVLQNMLELYLYEMSGEIDDKLELNDDGLYGDPWLEYYWKEAERYPYLLTIDGKYAGFSLIREIEPKTFYVAEFFVIRKYRKNGVGMTLIKEMFRLHKGKWLINTAINNTTAQSFWRKVAKSASCGNYKEYSIEDGRRLEWSFNNK